MLEQPQAYFLLPLEPSKRRQFEVFFTAACRRIHVFRCAEQLISDLEKNCQSQPFIFINNEVKVSNQQMKKLQQFGRLFSSFFLEEDVNQYLNANHKAWGNDGLWLMQKNEFVRSAILRHAILTQLNQERKIDIENLFGWGYFSREFKEEGHFNTPHLIDITAESLAISGLCKLKLGKFMDYVTDKNHQFIDKIQTIRFFSDGLLYAASASVVSKKLDEKSVIELSRKLLKLNIQLSMIQLEEGLQAEISYIGTVGKEKHQAGKASILLLGLARLKEATQAA